MLDDDIQRELLRETVEPESALSIVVNMEMGHQNQQQISSSNNNNASGSTINAIKSLNRFHVANARGNQTCRMAINRATIGQCRGCGQTWTPTHRQVCPLWVRNAIIVVFSIIPQRYVGKSYIIQEILVKIIASIV